MTEKNKDKSEKKIEVSSFSKELLLIVFGALIGILGNQVFFRENKDYEMKVELQKELLKEQYQYLNRILLFTHKYEITTGIYYTQPREIRKYIIDGTNEVVKTDTVLSEAIDSTSITLPSFIMKETFRQKFIEDIGFIKSNKDKIDHEVYAKFEELLDIIDKNPLPKTSEYNELRECNWNKIEVQEKWHNTTSELYQLTYWKLY